jgi:hypothetical protein
LDDATQRLKNTHPEPGSFRDWDSRVFASEGRVLRALSADGLAGWRALESSGLYRSLSEDGEIVDTRLADREDLEVLRGVDPTGDWKAVLSHERMPFVSYPYEWTFSMLQDAALLQLRLMSAALDEGLILKDASPYNVQWRGSRPVFVDVGSFERVREGEAWAGYRQFCMLFLYPLMLEAYRGVPFQPWLRGNIEGIVPTAFRSLFGSFDVLKPGMLRHVFLHAGLERRNAAQVNTRDELAAAGFDHRLIKANVERLARLVAGLRSRVDPSAWQSYRSTCSYSASETLEKEVFVRRALGRRRRTLTWDLGCNDGRFSLLASRQSAATLALDSDVVVVDGLYRSLRERGDSVVLPLVVDAANPSPAMGWRNAERTSLVDRGSPDLVLCLALVHHLSITCNLPLREIVGWLRSLDCDVVLEFPDRADPMVRRLLAGKRDNAHPDYSSSTFEELLRASFRVVETLQLTSGTRRLYHVLPE